MQLCVLHEEGSIALPAGGCFWQGLACMPVLGEVHVGVSGPMAHAPSFCILLEVLEVVHSVSSTWKCAKWHLRP